MNTNMTINEFLEATKDTTPKSCDLTEIQHFANQEIDAFLDRAEPLQSIDLGVKYDHNAPWVHPSTPHPQGIPGSPSPIYKGGEALGVPVLGFYIPTVQRVPLVRNVHSLHRNHKTWLRSDDPWFHRVKWFEVNAFKNRHLRSKHGDLRLTDKFKTGRMDSKKDANNHFMISPSWLCSMIMSAFNIDATMALRFLAALHMVREKDHTDGTRYGLVDATFNALPQFFKDLFVVDDTTYRVGNDSALRVHMFEFLHCMDGSAMSIDKTTVIPKRSQSLRIEINDFMTMSLYSQLILMRSLFLVKNGTMYIHLKRQQENGNQGRQYNIINEIARPDRHLILSMKGIDMDTALQAILVSKLGLRPTTFTAKYIEDKVFWRDRIATLMRWSLADTKMEITAIYQGRHYNPKKYKKLKFLFDEVAIIRGLIMDIFFNGEDESIPYVKARLLVKTGWKPADYTRPYKKATKLTPGKGLSPSQKRKFENTVMFFYWTYYERKIQDIIAAYMGNSILTLHDAVYTQDLDVYADTLESIDVLEEEIFTRTGIHIGLSEA